MFIMDLTCWSCLFLEENFYMGKPFGQKVLLKSILPTSGPWGFDGGNKLKSPNSEGKLFVANPEFSFDNPDIST